MGEKLKTKNTGKQSGKPRAKKRAAGVYDDFTLPTVVGVLDCKGDRFGFIANDGGDVFISGKDLNGARHGDTVRAVIINERRGRYGAPRREGRVTDIVRKNTQNIVATVEFSDNIFYAVPDERRFGEKLEITSLGGASDHDKVVISLEADVGGDGDRAKVLAVLGRYDEIGIDVKSVIAAHGLRTEFPKAAIAQADALPDVIDESEAAAPYRVDFRGETVFTIDGSDSKDFDDAVSIKRTDEGYVLGVYIADVAQYVTEKTPLDREALLRGNSVYLADRVIPMLPEKLSNGLCSLNEGEDRLTLAVIMRLDESGRLISSEIKEGVIRSTARLTYTGVQAMLDGSELLRKKYARVFPSLEMMKELAEKRIRLRHERGSIDFDLTETEIKFDASGHVSDIQKRPSLFSMRIIEEFMILANCAVAETFVKLKTPFVYRVHERPPLEKLQTLNDWLEAVGSRARCPLCPTPQNIAELLKSIDPSLSVAMSRVTLRSMSKATYEPMNEGHFGLAEKFYCHFTSPIRRYSDLMVHRIIKAYLHGGIKAAAKFKDAAKEAASKCSDNERKAQDCERKVCDYKKAEYMSRHIGERYIAVISSVTDFGFFAELENSAEGLVRMSALPPSASFDPKRLMIVCGMKKFRLGDEVEIIVEKAEGDRIDFRLA